jgi:predicted nucleic acid-binding protein
VVAYFPEECLKELHAKLDEFATRYRIPRERLDVAWQEYRLGLLICPTKDVPIDPQAIRDPNDLPFLKLRELVDAHVVISRDKDIIVTGVLTIASDDIRFELREFARSTNLHLTVMVAGSVVVRVGLIAIVGLINGLLNALRALPPAVLLLIALGTVAVLLHPTSRGIVAQALRKGSSVLRDTWKLLEPTLERLLSEADVAKLRSDNARARIVARIPELVRPPVVVSEEGLPESARGQLTQKPKAKRKRAALGPPVKRRSRARRGAKRSDSRNSKKRRQPK